MYFVPQKDQHRVDYRQTEDKWWVRPYLSGEDNFQLPASRTLLLQLHPMLPLRRECYYKLIEANEPISSFQIIATSLAAKALTGHPQESSSISSCPNWMKQSSNMCQDRMGWNPFHPSFASKTSTLVIFFCNSWTNFVVFDHKRTGDRANLLKTTPERLWPLIILPLIAPETWWRGKTGQLVASNRLTK